MPGTSSEFSAAAPRKPLRTALLASLVVLFAIALLAAVIWVPATLAAPPSAQAGSFSIVSVWTSGDASDPQTVFARGERIRYRANIENQTGAAVQVPFTWAVTGPCGTSSLWTGNLNVPQGGSSWTLTGTIASDACVGPYTFVLSATYGGQTISRSSQYSVREPTRARVSVVSAWTANAQDVYDTTFVPGEAIRYRGNVENTGSVAVSAPFTYTIVGPCGTLVNRYDLNVPPGASSWTLTGTIATTACPGQYTFTLSTRYDGVASSKSSTYHVASTGSAVSVITVWTTNAQGTLQTRFNRGDAIRYRANIDNQTGMAVTVPVTWSLSSACGSSILATSNLQVPPLGSSWILTGTIPPNACLGQYTFVVSLNYGGRISSQSSQYTVGTATAGQLKVVTAWTANAQDFFDTTFLPGEAIRYRGNLENTGGAAVTAPFTYTIVGPCGVWVRSYNLSVPPMASSWTLTGTIASTACPGPYTFMLSTLYGGIASSYSSNYHVVGTGHPVSVVSAWTADTTGRAQSRFDRGDQVRYYANVFNDTDGPATAHFAWEVSGPCGTRTLWSGEISTGQKMWMWDLPSTITSTACTGDHTYTVRVTYGGQITSESATFTISGVTAEPQPWKLYLPWLVGGGIGADLDGEPGPSGAPAPNVPVIVTGVPTGVTANDAERTLVVITGTPARTWDADGQPAVIITGKPFMTPLPRSRDSVIVTGKPEWVPWTP